MKQVLQLRGGAKTVREVPVPTCPPGSVLVRNAFSVISSGTERASGEPSGSLARKAASRPDLVREVIGQVAREGPARTRQAIQRRLAQASALGYSSAGEIIEVGGAVTGLSPGDRVACAGVGFANHAEVVAVPRNLCARVPQGVALETAALTTIATVALHGIRLADVRVGDRTAVIGCGLIGRITCRLLRAAGAEIFALDLDEARAAGAGGDHAYGVGPHVATEIMGATDGNGVDHVLITAAAPTNEPLLLAGDIARDRAELVIVGDVPVDIPRSVLFSKELRLQVSRSYGPGRYDPDYERHGVDYPIGYVRWTQQRNMECILDLQARGQVDFADLVEQVVPADDAPSAYERLSGPPEQRPIGALVISYPPRDDEQLPVRAPAAPAPTAAPEPLGPNAPVRVGLIGPGDFASSVIIPALDGAGAKLATVGGGSGPSATAAARDFGFDRVASSEDAVIADPQVDAVAICTRHDTHAELATRALEAGKHVFCEKPLALSVEELDRVVDAARRTGRIVAVGFNRRFAPQSVELREFLAGGGGPVTVTYRVSAGELPRSHWVHDLQQGGGRVLGEVCHFIDMLVFLAGSPAAEVYASGFSRIGAPTQAQDNVAITVRHADGSLGTIAYVATSASGIGKERVEAFGPAGVGVLDDFRSLELHGGSPKATKGAQRKGHAEELQAFVQAVRAGQPPVPLDEVENVSLATIAAVESMRTGTAVRIDG